MAFNGSLYLVTGCDKATAWGIASWCSEADQGEISLTFTTSELMAGRASYSYSSETCSLATVCVGPEVPSHQKNQCIFLRGFKIAVRESALAKVVGPITVTSIVGTRPSKILPKAYGGSIPFSESRQRTSGHGLSSGSSSSNSSTRESSNSPSSFYVNHSGDHSDDSLGDDVQIEMIPPPSEVSTSTTSCYHVMNLHPLAISSTEGY
jgi:hypothetical protein